jgi:hypothetical protein
MTGKRYYITTLGDWQRHAARFANSHWLALESESVGNDVIPNPAAPFADGGEGSVFGLSQPDGATRILVLIEADEGVHLALEDDAAFEALPHPLAQKPISHAAQSALAPHSVAPGATTFDVAEAAARVHPLLKHRVF